MSIVICIKHKICAFCIRRKIQFVYSSKNCQINNNILYIPQLFYDTFLFLLKVIKHMVVKCELIINLFIYTTVHEAFVLCCQNPLTFNIIIILIILCDGFNVL